MLLRPLGHLSVPLIVASPYKGLAAYGIQRPLFYNIAVGMSITNVFHMANFAETDNKSEAKSLPYG